jgi:formylglycine-generating enzyme
MPNLVIKKFFLVVLYLLFVLCLSSCGLFKTNYEKLIPEMIQIGETNIQYNIPLGLDNSESDTVSGGYSISIHETTYELWYHVRLWSEKNGYSYQNLGKEGSHGNTGEKPSKIKEQPVTEVSWRDVAVWLNGLSELFELTPVYLSTQGEVVKDSRDSNLAILSNLVVEPSNSGYRLPSLSEWEMAARWLIDKSVLDSAIEKDNTYWTPGDYVSGSIEDIHHTEHINQLAWYLDNSMNSTHIVGLTDSNFIGIYDMGGNVWEWCNDWYDDTQDTKVIKGGAFNSEPRFIRIGFNYFSSPNSANNAIGFRILKN